MSRVKGWCPSAHRPMMSGDGLLVRVKPRLGRLSTDRVLALCDLADRFGNGMIDLTSRANLQIRGVAEADHPGLLAALVDAGLVDADAEREARRNIVANCHWLPGSATVELEAAIVSRLGDLPELPDKMGVAIDIGRVRSSGIPGDFRFEQSIRGLILRADGAQGAWHIDKADSVDALLEMARWFVDTGGRDSGRMHRHLKRVTLPEAWQSEQPVLQLGAEIPGQVGQGFIIGVPFGTTDAAGLRALVQQTKAAHVRVTPWRLLLLEGVDAVDIPGFLTKQAPVLAASACPGAPACAEATVPTRDLARRLVGRVDGALHVSGCVKGCARQAPAAVTLVGREGRFDLVREGRAGDTPERLGLSDAEILELVG